MEENNTSCPVCSSVQPGIAMNEDGYKKRKGVMVSIFAVLAIILFTISIIFVYRILFRKPESRLTNGFVNMAAEWDTYGNSSFSDIGFGTIVRNIWQEPVTAD